MSKRRDERFSPTYQFPTVRLLTTSIILAVVLCLPFLIWGDQFMQWFTGDAAIQWIRGWGAWGWLAVIGLLMSDLFLPIPATPVMSAAGRSEEHTSELQSQ